jgi:hypothetical protein
VRLAIYYSIVTGRNDGNPLYVWRALKRRQEKGELEIDHLAPKADVINHGTYDYHIWVDWGEDGLTPLIPYDIKLPPYPSAYWASDTHLGYDYRLMMAKNFQHAFVAQKEAVGQFKRDGVVAEWLPHAFEPEAYHDLMNRDEKGVPQPFEFISKKFDVSFVGHVNSENREDYLDRMFKEFPHFYFGQKQFQDAAYIYAQSKIVLNLSMKKDLNMRCFEALGSKSCLLTDRVPGMDDLGFIDGETCILFDTFDEAVEKAKYYLKNEEERTRIAEAGYQLVMNRHTIDHRVDTILSKMNNKVLIGG